MSELNVKRRVAIIGGTGFSVPSQWALNQVHQVQTPFQAAQVEVTQYSYRDTDIFFMSRHGSGASIAPHQVNYRANIAALSLLQVDTIVALNAVGAIDKDLMPGDLIIPQQIIDYSYGRQSTFFDGVSPSLQDPMQKLGTISPLQHVDFTEPYTEGLRRQLYEQALQQGITIVGQGVYGCTQGPRLETAAEIQRMANDGCSLVGMTGMPEAVLAKELTIDYAAICLVVNMAAGLADAQTEADIRRFAQTAMLKTTQLLDVWLCSLSGAKD